MQNHAWQINLNREIGKMQMARDFDFIFHQICTEEGGGAQHFGGGKGKISMGVIWENPGAGGSMETEYKHLMIILFYFMQHHTWMRSTVFYTISY